MTWQTVAEVLGLSTVFSLSGSSVAGALAPAPCGLDRAARDVCSHGQALSDAAAAPGAERGGAAEARSAAASYVPVTRKVGLTAEKNNEKAQVFAHGSHLY